MVDTISKGSLQLSRQTADSGFPCRTPSDEFYDNNTEHLYPEVLYCILHKLGIDDEEIPQEKLIAHLKEAFQISDETHESLLAGVRGRKAPNVLLNVRVIEARNLRPKDANGLSDPFCTLFLSNYPTQLYDTSVKKETLAPVWEEPFSLSVVNIEDSLTVEVYAYSDAEKVLSPLSKTSKIKGLHGTRILFKDLCTRKHTNKLIGVANVPLKNIRCCGQETWIILEKQGKKKLQGELKLRVSLGIDKQAHQAFHELRHLLRILLRHEVRTTSQRWSGEFSEMSRRVLNQYVAQSSLDAEHEALANWAEFCAAHQTTADLLRSTVHQTHQTVSYQVLGRVFEKLVKPLQNGQFNNEEVILCWESTKKLLPALMTYIRHLHKLNPKDETSLEDLTALLRFLTKLSSLKPPEGVDLFSFSSFPGRGIAGVERSSCDLKEGVREELKQGARDWVNHTNQMLLEISRMEGGTDDMSKFKRITNIVTKLHTNLQAAAKRYDKIFQEEFEVPYAKITYGIFYEMLRNLTEASVVETCKNLKPLKFDAQSTESSINEDVALGTQLFSLYRALQQFAKYGADLGVEESVVEARYHTWFSKAVTHWLDVAICKAKVQIRSAVKLDRMQPQDSVAKHSTSAPDLIFTLEMIKITWTNLNWPDLESSYCHMNKLIDEIYQSTIFYAEQMCLRVQALSRVDEGCKISDDTLEWCTMISNMEYMTTALHTFLLGLIKELPGNSEHFRDKLTLAVDEAMDNVMNKTAELLDNRVDEIGKTLLKFVTMCAEDRTNARSDQLNYYMNLIIIREMRDHLKEEHGRKILVQVWQKLIRTDLPCFIDVSLQSRKPFHYFKNVLRTIYQLENFFSCTYKELEQDVTDAENSCVELLKNMKITVRLHGLETPQLVHKYHLTRLAEQDGLSSPPKNSGLLTVRLFFVQNTLHVNIMNARYITPDKEKGTRDLFVYIRLLPKESFKGVPKHKTKTHHKNLCPLFDETFAMPLNEVQQGYKESLLYLVLKDCNMVSLRKTEVVGEAFVKLSSIVSKADIPKLESVTQLHLPITIPSKVIDYHELGVLKYRRQGDPIAKQFLKKEEEKCSKS